MPYIITTNEPFDAAVHVHRPAFTRRAVATLEEARQRVFEVCEDTYGIGRNVEAQILATRSITEEGGTVGSLPDGTVIEVKRVSRHDLEYIVGLEHHGITLDRVLEAFNAESVR